MISNGCGYDSSAWRTHATSGPTFSDSLYSGATTESTGVGFWGVTMGEATVVGLTLVLKQARVALDRTATSNRHSSNGAGDPFTKSLNGNAQTEHRRDRWGEHAPFAAGLWLRCHGRDRGRRVRLASAPSHQPPRRSRMTGTVLSMMRKSSATDWRRMYSRS